MENKYVMFTLCPAPDFCREGNPGEMSLCHTISGANRNLMLQLDFTFVEGYVVTRINLNGSQMGEWLRGITRRLQGIRSQGQFQTVPLVVPSTF